MKIKPKTLYHWYKHYLSDYKKDTLENKFPNDKLTITDDTTGKTNSAVVYIFEPKNMGKVMLIDEKYIGKKYSVILSNQATGKIALLVETMIPSLIEKALLKFSIEVR